MCHWPIGLNNLIIFQQHNLNERCWKMVGYIWVIYLTRRWLISCRTTACAAFNTENYSHWWLLESQEVWHSYLVGLLLLTTAIIFANSNSKLETEVWTWKSRIHNYRWCKWWLPPTSNPPTSVCSRPALILILGIWHDICACIWCIVNPINPHC